MDSLTEYNRLAYHLQSIRWDIAWKLERGDFDIVSRRAKQAISVHANLIAWASRD